MDNWQILDTGPASAEENMRKDAELLDSLKEGMPALLHFYEWEKTSATYGHFVEPSHFLQMEQVEKVGLDLARRPTGGGIIFHIWDYAFSVLVPSSHRSFSQNTLDNYGFVNRAVLQAAKEFIGNKKSPILIEDDFISRDRASSRFCMAQPTKYDVVWEGKKIAGAAQRKTKSGFLHQGSISLMMPSSEYLEQLLLPGTEVLSAMHSYTFPLLGSHATIRDLKEAKVKLKQLLAKYLTRES